MQASCQALKMLSCDQNVAEDRTGHRPCRLVWTATLAWGEQHLTKRERTSTRDRCFLDLLRATIYTWFPPHNPASINLKQVSNHFDFYWPWNIRRMQLSLKLSRVKKTGLLPIEQFLCLILSLSLSLPSSLSIYLPLSSPHSYSLQNNKKVKLTNHKCVHTQTHTHKDNSHIIICHCLLLCVRL